VFDLEITDELYLEDPDAEAAEAAAMGFTEVIPAEREAPHGPHPLRVVVIGLITLGTHSERFACPLGYWSIAAYRRQWLEGAGRLLAGEERSAVVTGMYDPGIANFIVWRPMYRVSGGVAVQEQLLFMNQLDGRLDEDDLYRHVDARDPNPVPGESPLEWLVSLDDLRGFVERRR
jgi:hypothetical protein